MRLLKKVGYGKDLDPSWWRICKNVLCLKILDSKESENVTEGGGEKVCCEQQQVFFTGVEGGVETLDMFVSPIGVHVLHDFAVLDPKRENDGEHEAV